MTAIDAGTISRSDGLERWKRIALGTLKLFFDPDTAPRCAGTAFFGFLSLFPAIATVFLIYGLVADARCSPTPSTSFRYLLPGDGARYSSRAAGHAREPDRTQPSASAS